MCFEAVIGRLLGAWVTPQPGGIRHIVSDGASGGRLCSCYPLTVCSADRGTHSWGLLSCTRFTSQFSLLDNGVETEQRQTSLACL